MPIKKINHKMAERMDLVDIIQKCCPNHFPLPSQISRMLYADLNEEHLRLLEAPFIQSMFAADDMWDARGLHQDPEEALARVELVN